MSIEDRAQAEEAAEWERNNRPRDKAPSYKPGEPGYGPEFCKNPECEDVMPDLRRREGRHFCTECQSLKERRARLRY